MKENVMKLEDDLDKKTHEVQLLVIHYSIIIPICHWTIQRGGLLTDPGLWAGG